MFRKKQQTFTRHDDNPEFIDLWFKAQELYEDPIEQLDYVRKHGTSQMYLLALLTKAQFVMSLSQERSDIGSGQFDCLYRAILDAVGHMKDDLPDGVYHYIISNLEDLTRSLIQKHSKKC